MAGVPVASGHKYDIEDGVIFARGMLLSLVHADVLRSYNSVHVAVGLATLYLVDTLHFSIPFMIMTSLDFDNFSAFPV